MAVVRVGAAVVFVLLLALPFFYRGAWAIDRIAFVLGVASVGFGLLIGRDWAVALPLAAVAFAVARDGGGDDWLGFSGLVCLYTVPGLAFGLGLVAVVG